MSRLVSACLVAGLLSSGVAGNAVAADEAPDRHAWLEDVTGDKPLQWVKAQNAKAEAEIAATPEFKQLEGRILTMLDSDAKIPGVQKIGAHYYNSWKDKDHERGVWRRTTL